VSVLDVSGELDGPDPGDEVLSSLLPQADSVDMLASAATAATTTMVERRSLMVPPRHAYGCHLIVAPSMNGRRHI
jgi:hypothetical protein